jgi:hypothetical protein
MGLQWVCWPLWREYGGDILVFYKFIMNQGESIITSAEALRTLRQNRYNPLRGMTATRLAQDLDAFEYGEVRACALLWEVICERDDTLKAVKPKREKSVSSLELVVSPIEGSGDAGLEQEQVVREFWKNARATDAYDRNKRGGLRLLIQQMMTAVSYRYAAHHIVWSPRASGLTATFEFVPLWLFENKTGSLRFLETPYAIEGKAMDEGEWLVTTGDGLMISCCIGWLAKRESYNDWLIFSSRFAVPGVLGRTKASKDSPEGKAMRAAVLAFGQEMKGVIYNDDGAIKDPIEIIQAEGSPNGMPMPAILERVDRKMAALYMGADLSTMSSGSGEGAGASLQGEQLDILIDDDAVMIAEKLTEISRMVIEWHFGADADFLVELSLKPRAAKEAENAAGEPNKKADPAKAYETTPTAETKDDNAKLIALLKESYSDVAALIEQAMNATGDQRIKLLQDAVAMLPEKISNPELDDAVAQLLTNAFIDQTQETAK